MNLTDFYTTAVGDAIAHARAAHPEEACGLIVDSAYIPCTNGHAQPDRHFLIPVAQFAPWTATGRLDAIVHSHNDFAHASHDDLAQQHASRVPWCILNLKHGACTDVLWFGDQAPVAPLAGRKFHHGIYDCYSLVRDYYRIHRRTGLPVYPREINWWHTGEDLITRNLHNAGFQPVTTPRTADVVVMSIGAAVPNHCAVYIGQGLILHHLYGRLSRIEPLTRWRKYIAWSLRYGTAA